MAVAAVATGDLLEREHELRELEDLLADAKAGHGRAVFIEGPAGIGKTAMLAAARRRALDTGLSVLSASGAELERAFPLGVVRQLFEPCLVGVEATTRERRLQGPAGLAAPALGPGAADDSVMASPADREAATLHGLYWLTANLASELAVAIVVDDLHWADPPSLRFVVYLLRRLAGLPVAVLLATRPAELGAKTELGLRISAEPATRIVRPQPLSAAGVGLLARRIYGRDPEDAFVHACTQATGGTPFLVETLLGDLHASAVPPTAAGAAVMPRAAPEAVRRSLALRLARLPRAAVDLAQALAVLGAEATLGDLAAVAGLGEPEAARAASALVAAGVLDGRGPVLGFVHALVRAAVYEDLPVPVRSVRHAAAADALRARGAPDTRVAAQLAACEPRGDAGTVELLRGVAGDALAQGAVDVAVGLLERALAEPPPDAECGHVLHSLGAAELQLGRPHAVEHLRAAHAALVAPADRARAAIDLARAHERALANAEAVAVLDATLADPGLDRELRLRMEAEAALIGRHDLRTRDRARERIDELAAAVAGETPGERLVLAAAGQMETSGEVPDSAATVAGKAERQLERQLAAGDALDPQTLVHSVLMLQVTDRFEAAEALVEQFIANARDRGWTEQYVYALAIRGQGRLLRGDVLNAEADGAMCLEIATLAGGRLPPPAHVLLIGMPRLARGDLVGADAAFAEIGLGGPLPEIQMFNPVLYYRAELRLSQGRPEDALTDLNELGRRLRALGYRTPALPWQAAAARAHLALGHVDEARALAHEQLELARAWDTPRSLAVAHRTLGLVEGGEQGLAWLRTAMLHARSCPSPLELAESEVELGAALHRAGRAAEARRPLTDAMDRAHACGATALAERARAELRATGARPRRLAVTGAAALTPSERRIAELAVAGRSNRDIAQELFVTVRTVETHLANAFRKVGARGRDDLAARLQPAP